MVTAMTANRRDFPGAVCWPRCFGRARQETPDERTLKNRLPLLQLRVYFKARSSPSYCVRFSRLFVRSSMIWRYRFVRCVLMCISPVALHTQRARSVWSLRVTYEFAVGLLRLSGRSCIVRVIRAIPHILPPSSLIYSDRFDPAIAACGPPASHCINPVGCPCSGGSGEVYGLP
jgi:hypothetical protein